MKSKAKKAVLKPVKEKAEEALTELKKIAHIGCLG